MLDEVQPLLLDLLLRPDRGAELMRLLRLDLKAVGPFTDVSLDLSAGDHGLHLIYGPNEAGKTSTLRALSHLLFGFPLRTADDFVHPYDQLRVGAVLRHSDGEVLEVVRRKATKNTLRGPDDTAVVAPERLERFLGGLDQESFETLFGIDHARLASAGDEIRTGQGRLGELLFAAGTGLAGLRQAQERLQEPARRACSSRGARTRGSTRRWPSSGPARRSSRSSSFRARCGSSTTARYREAQERAAGWASRSPSRNVERNRLERIRAAMPLAARRRTLRAELRRPGRRRPPPRRLRQGLPRRAGIAATGPPDDRRRPARRSIPSAPSSRRSSRRGPCSTRPTRSRRSRSASAPWTRHGRTGSRLENFLADHAHQARRLLRELGRPEDLDAAEALRLRADEPAIIRALAKQFAALSARRDETLKAIARLEDQVERLDRKLADLGEPRDIEPLRHAVRQARKAGDLDDRHDQARAAQAAVRESGRAGPGPAAGLVADPRRPRTAGRAARGHARPFRGRDPGRRGRAAKPSTTSWPPRARRSASSRPRSRP